MGKHGKTLENELTTVDSLVMSELNCADSECVLLTTRQKTRANSSSSCAFCGSNTAKSCCKTSSWVAA